jgi:hypothetical protein
MVTVAARTGDRSGLVQAAVVLFALAMVAVAVATGDAISIAALALVLVSGFAAGYRVLTGWPTVVGLIVAVILFIPITRYKFAAGLPFDLEPYRVAVAVIVLLWIAALLVDERVRLRGSFLDPPLMFFLFAIIGSVLTNLPQIGATFHFIVQSNVFARGDLSDAVLKKTLFLASFYLVFYLVVSVIRTKDAIHTVLKTLVGGASLVGLAGIYEARSGYNVFNHIGGLLPLVSFEGGIASTALERGGRLRVYASAQHPIALAALFAMLLPLAIYLARYTRQKRWWLAALIIGLAALSATSRTGVIMLVIIALVFLWLRPADIKKLWPLLLPAALVVHLALPGTIGTLRASFFPQGGLIAEQSSFTGRTSGDRIGPVVDKIEENPAFGQGYGSRITEEGLRQNAHVLDDEWLGTTAETGLFGFAAWIWIFARFVRRAGREAKRDYSPRGWFLTAVASSVAAFAFGMVTYDAFSFIQVTFVLYILMGLAACAVMSDEEWAPESGPLPAAELRRRQR